MKKEIVIKKFRTNLPVRFDTDEDAPCLIHGCIFTVDEKSGECLEVERVELE